MGGVRMKVRDIGLKDVFCAAPEMSLTHIASMMKRHNVGVIPVCEGTKLLGVITDRDMVVSCVAAGMDTTKCIAREFMTSNPIFVNPDTDLETAARVMGKEQVHRLAVVDDDVLVGMISLGDISMALSRNDNLVADTLRKISMPTQAVPVC
jgi:CBS domain-containing protein